MTFDEALALYESGREWLEVPLEEREALLQRLEVGQLPGSTEERDRQAILRGGRATIADVERRRSGVLKATEGLPRQPYQPSFVGEVLKPAGQALLEIFAPPMESATQVGRMLRPSPAVAPERRVSDQPVSQPALEAPAAQQIAPKRGDLGLVAPEAQTPPPPPVQGPPAPPSDFYRTQVEPFVEAGKGLLFRGPVKLFDWLDEQAERLSQATGWSKGGLFRDIANLARQQASGEPVDPTFATRVLSKIAEFPTAEMPKLLAFTTNLGTIPGFAALGALEGSKQGTKEALIGAFTNALFGAELKALQPLGLGARVTGGATAFAGQAAAAGERNPEKLLEAAAEGAIFLAPGTMRGQQVRRILREGYGAEPQRGLNLFTRLGLDPATVTLPELREAVTQQAQALEGKIGRATSDKQRRAGIVAYQELVQDFREAQQVLGREIPVRPEPTIAPTPRLPAGREPTQIPGIVAPGAIERPQIPGPPVAGEVRGGRVYGGGPIEPRPERFDVLRPGQGRVPQVPALRPEAVEPPVVERPVPLRRQIREEAERIISRIPEKLEIRKRLAFLIPQPREAPVSAPRPTAAREAVSVKDIHRLADSKGISWDNNETFMALTEQVTGKQHLDKLTPAERQQFYTVLERLKFRPSPKVAPTPRPVEAEYPSIGETTALTEKLKQAGRLPAITAPIEEVPPRHALPPEENAELYARALKAKADLEIAGTERGGRFFTEVAGQGGTPEVVGLKSPTARWYKEATSGPGKLSRERVERAVQKILEDQGRDKGKDVERIKELLFRDREFMKTPFAPKSEAEWKTLIQEALQPYQSETAGLSVILPREVPELGAPKRRPPAPAIAPAEPRQEVMPLPVPTIGERPIIGREVTAEEAPLFSKAAKEPEPEQQRLRISPEEREGVRALAEVMAKKEAPQPTQDLIDYATDVVNRSGVQRIVLVGSRAATEKGRDTDLIYDFGKIGLPKESAEASSRVESLVESAPIDLDRFDTFIKADGRYFHVSSGAGREVIENTEYAKEQAGKPSMDLATARSKPQKQERLTELGAPLQREALRPTTEPSVIAETFRDEATDAAKKVRPRQLRIPVAPITGGPSKPLTDIVLDLEKGIGQKVTIGKPGPRRAGVYQPGSTATVIRFSGDLDTTAHEMAHALDDRYGLVKDWRTAPSSPFDAELEPFAQHGSVTSTGPRASPTYRRAEGVAEWMRAWLVNPEAAEAAAPRFTQHVKDRLPKDIQQSLKQFSDQVRQWAGNTAHAKIMANVQWETPESGLLHWLTGGRTAKGPGFQLTVFDQLASAMTDRLAPFMKALEYARTERGLTAKPLPSNDPALLSRLYMGIHAKMDDIFAKGMIDAKLERATAGGLNWMLEPLDRTSPQALERDMQEVASLMIAQRTVERIEKDIARQVEAIKQLKLTPEEERQRIVRVETAARQRKISGAGAGIEEDITVAEARVRELRNEPERFARLNEAAERYRQWADANLRYLVDKGRLSEQQYAAIKANNEYYVAMQRLIEVSPGEELVVSVPRGVTTRKLGTVTQPIKEFKGSTRTIKNPYLSLMDATYQAVWEADRNEVLGLFRDLLTTGRGMHEGEPIELASVGRLARSGEKHTIPIYRNGQQEIWQFHPEVYKALKGIEEGAYKLPWLVTILPRVLRATIVNAPPFALRNLIRDAWHRTIMSTVASKPWDTLKPYTQEEISKLRRSGGDQAGHYYTDSQNYARALKFAMGEAVKDQQSLVVDPSKAWHWAKKGGEGYLDLMQQSERQGRLAEYRRALEHAKTKLHYDDYHAMLYAASQARGLLDYGVAGNWMLLMNQVIPFSNAAVQGVRVNVLRAKADPLRYATRFGVFAVVPALLTYAWNYLFDDDLEEYRQLPAYQRDLFWNFKLGPDLWLKIPKPFEIGVLATTFERALDAAMGNEKAFEGHVGAFLRTLLPVDEASFAGPLQGVVQAMANYDFFRDRPIVPRWEENLALELRTYNRASRLGQALQEAIGVDARKIDFIMQQQFGYLGRWAVDISDVGRKEKTGLTLSAAGIFGISPAGASLDVQWVMEQAEQRGVAASKGKLVDRLKSVKDVRATMSGVKNPDAVRYGVFRKILDRYHEAQSDEERERLATQLRAEANTLRGLWEKSAPNPKADERAQIKRQQETGELTKDEAAKQLKQLQRRRIGQPAVQPTED